ncbi:hypothetical protein IAU59_007255 [Kwoniella sp. CBS 9459]
MSHPSTADSAANRSRDNPAQSSSQVFIANRGYVNVLGRVERARNLLSEAAKKGRLGHNQDSKVDHLTLYASDCVLDALAVKENSSQLPNFTDDLSAEFIQGYAARLGSRARVTDRFLRELPSSAEGENADYVLDKTLGVLKSCDFSAFNKDSFERFAEDTIQLKLFNAQRLGLHMASQAVKYTCDRISERWADTSPTDQEARALSHLKDARAEFEKVVTRSDQDTVESLHTKTQGLIEVVPEQARKRLLKHQQDKLFSDLTCVAAFTKLDELDEFLHQEQKQFVISMDDLSQAARYKKASSNPGSSGPASIGGKQRQTEEQPETEERASLPGMSTGGKSPGPTDDNQQPWINGTSVFGLSRRTMHEIDTRKNARLECDKLVSSVEYTPHLDYADTVARNAISSLLTLSQDATRVKNQYLEDLKARNGLPFEWTEEEVMQRLKEKENKQRKGARSGGSERTDRKDLAKYTHGLQEYESMVSNAIRSILTKIEDKATPKGSSDTTQNILSDALIYRARSDLYRARHCCHPLGEPSESMTMSKTALKAAWRTENRVLEKVKAILPSSAAASRGKSGENDITMHSTENNSSLPSDLQQIEKGTDPHYEDTESVSRAPGDETLPDTSCESDAEE